MNRIGSILAALAVAAVCAVSGEGWGSDINPGDGTKLAAAVHEELLALIAAPAAEREALAVELAKRRGNAAIEAWKRFRNHELVALARACVVSDDWKLAHRGLVWCRKLGDAECVPLAWPLLSSSVARLREAAALACLELWNPKVAKGVAGGKAKEGLAALRAKEDDGAVAAALTALEQRLAGKLKPRELASEITVECDDGLVWTPFLEGMDKLAAVAPGAKLVQNNAPGGGSALKLPVASRFTGPMCGWPREEVAGVGLQPFANPRQDGTVFHTGQDLGACLDGAGYYAIASGIVRFVHWGSDMGTLLVVEHHRAAKELVNAVYMHGGSKVFVEAGDKVAAGQLLGTQGLSFSIENGGHFAHLHFGLYPGPFSLTHNYGYKPASAGLNDWFDPAKVLPEWIAANPAAPTKR